MQEFKVIEEAHGLYIIIDDRTREIVNKYKNWNAKRKYQVTVKVDGRIKHMTLNSFMKKLGFRVSAKKSANKATMPTGGWSA